VARTSARLASAVLEGEDPREFLRKHADAQRAKHGIKLVADFEWVDFGIDNSQYWPGIGTSYSDFDAAYGGAGDNPNEAANDALEQAVNDGWELDGTGIHADGFPDTPSVMAEYPPEDEDDMGDNDLYYYIGIRLKERKREEAEPVREAESPKSFFKKQFLPSTWPEIPRWNRTRKTFNKDDEFRRAYYDVQRQQYIRPEVEGEEPTYRPYTRRYNLPHTKFFRNRKDRTHWIEYYGSKILHWDAYGNLSVDNCGYFRQLTRERINHYLPHGWQIHTKRAKWYWFNNNWPENIRNRLWSDVSARRDPTFPWWIPYTRGDVITADGKLQFSKTGLALPEGDLKPASQNDMLKPPVGNLTPPRRKRDRYDPNQLHFHLEHLLEGHYLKQLAKHKRVRAKLDKMKEVNRKMKDLENIDKPDKRKKRFNLH